MMALILLGILDVGVSEIQGVPWNGIYHAAVIIT